MLPHAVMTRVPSASPLDAALVSLRAVSALTLSPVPDETPPWAASRSMAASCRDCVSRERPLLYAKLAQAPTLSILQHAFVMSRPMVMTTALSQLQHVTALSPPVATVMSQPGVLTPLPVPHATPSQVASRSTAAWRRGCVSRERPLPYAKPA